MHGRGTPRGVCITPSIGRITPPRALGTRADVIVLFTKRRAVLEQRFAAIAAALDPAGGFWVAWPKRASKVPTSSG